MTKVKTVPTYIKQILDKYEGTEHHVLSPEGLKEMRVLLSEFVKFMNHEEIIEILTDYGIYLELQYKYKTAVD